MSDTIRIQHFSFVITERCTLACKLCSEYSPFYSDSLHASFNAIKSTIDSVFKHIDLFGDVSFFGGEPMLHPDIYECFIYLRKYINRFDRALILTNGTILPKEEDLKRLLDKVPEYREKLQFNISDYGPDLSKKVKEIEQLCRKLGVKCRIIKYYGDDMFCDGWIDYGDHSQKYFTESEIKEHAQKCHFRTEVSIVTHITDSEFYLSRCTRSFWRRKLRITPPDTSDVLCFHTEFKQEDIAANREKIKALLNAEYSDSCAYCNGMCDDSPRFKPAEQLTLEERKQNRKISMGGTS